MGRRSAKITMSEAAEMFMAAANELRQARAEHEQAGPYVNLEDAARYLGMPIGTLRTMVKRREVPHVVMCYGDSRGHPRFRKRDLDEMMERIPTLAEVKEGMASSCVWPHGSSGVG